MSLHMLIPSPLLPLSVCLPPSPPHPPPPHTLFFLSSSTHSYCGQVGYIVMGMRSVHDAHLGDTFHHTDSSVSPLPGFKPAKPMVHT